MSITNKGELLSALPNWLGRGDVTSTRYQEMVDMCDAKLRRTLRARDMETRNITFTIGAEYVTLPTDFLEVKSLYLNTDPIRPITHMPDDMMNLLFTSGNQKPAYFNIAGDSFRFRPVPDSSYSATLTYYARPGALSSGAANTATNWIINEHPDIYLYGSLVEAEGFLMNDARILTWRQQYDAAIAERKNSSNRSMWGSPGLQVRVT